jgi:hypothetical protein
MAQDPVERLLPRVASCTKDGGGQHDVSIMHI